MISINNNCKVGKAEVNSDKSKVTKTSDIKTILIECVRIFI